MFSNGTLLWKLTIFVMVRNISSTLMFSFALVSNRGMFIWLANLCASSVITTFLDGQSFLLPTEKKNITIKILNQLTVTTLTQNSQK